jgi:serine/threonine protein kinase
MTRPVTTPGRLVAGRYRLQSQIGGGGMGTVWLADDELLGRQVAVKQVLSAPGANAQETDQQRQRALREGRIAARLSHPHAISVYDVALEGGQPWLVMQYLPSRSLAAVLAEDGVLRVDQVAQIGAQVADALAATHAAGIVHRDVKPANVLIGQGDRIDGLVKITDFGISHASGDVTLTQTGQITGTPAFLAPEVAQGRPMTEASDVFSLGATLYTCIEGQPPFGMEDNALGMLHRVAGGQITPPRRAGSLTGPLLRMLAAEPAERPSMPEIRDELATLAAGRTGDTTTVLLARTDLGSAGQARNRTAAFPAASGPDGGAPTPPARPTAAPPPPRMPTASRPPRAPRRRRGRGLTILALVAAIIAGLILWAVVLDPAGDRSDAQGTPSTPSASADATPEGRDRAGAGAAEPTTEEPTAAPDGAEGPLTADNIEQFLDEYHELVLTDPRTAYARTGPTLRNAISEDNYVDYWSQFGDVTIDDVQATDGNPVATATLQLRFRGGGEETGRHQFTFLVEGGELILDSDVAA